MNHIRTVLDNGIRILTVNMPHVRSVTISVLLGVGSRYEPAEESGISHFVEHILFKGTRRWPTSRDIAEAIESTGGVLNGGTDKELTVFWAKVMDAHLERAIDVLADLIRNPLFNPEEAERERQVIIEEINMTLDSPQQWVNMLIDEVVWPDQSLGRDVAGSKETVNSLSPDKLKHYWQSCYGPQQTVISVAGNIQSGEAESMIARFLGDWSQGDSNLWFPASDEQETPRLHLESRESEQSHLCLALRGVSSRDPDRFVVDVLNVLLGEGMSCRLFREIRENKGLAYDVHSYVSHFLDSGALTIYAGVNPANLEAATEAILNELAQLRDVAVSDAELNKAKEMIKGRLLLRMEDSRSVSSWYGSQELLLEEIQTIEEVTSIIEAISSKDLQRVAAKMFQSRGLNLAAVGPDLHQDRLDRILKL